MKKSPYIKNGKELKRLGIISSSFDFRKKLTPAQKGVITKKMNEYGHVVKHPELFHITTVSKKTAKIIKDSGASKEKNIAPYKVIGRKVFLPLNGFAKASIRKGKIVYSNKQGILSETVVLSKSEDFLKTLKRLSTTKLKKNEFLTVKLGANDSFMRARFSTYADLYKYVTEYFAPHLSNKKRGELMAQMSIVKVVEPKRKPNAPKKNK